jgi:gliding motility-associated-like protein
MKLKIFLHVLGPVVVFAFLFLSSEEVYAQEIPLLEWARSMGGTGDDHANATAVDNAGNVYTTGYFNNTADFDPGVGVFNLVSAGTSDVFISKVDASGNFVWARSMGGTSLDVAHAIAVDPSGNVYTTGSFYGTADFDPGTAAFNLTAAGDMDVFISKLDTDGNFVWARSLSGANTEEAYAIAFDDLGYVLTIGYYRATTDFNPGAGTFNLTSDGSFDVFVSKIDADGNFVWAKSMGGYSSDRGYAVVPDASGNVYIAGDFYSNSGGSTADFDPGPGVFNLVANGLHDIFISKLDGSGNLVWAKSIGGVNDDYAYSLAVDALGNVYTTGNYSDTVDFDPGAGTFNLIATPRLAGSLHYAYDIYISKLDANGNFVWAKSIGSNLHDAARSIALDASDNVYVTGFFSGIVDFDPGPGVFILDPPGGIFIAKLNSNGAFVWAANMGGSVGSGDVGMSVVTNPGGGLYSVGHFQGTGDFDPTCKVFNLTSVGNYDFFVQKIITGTPSPSPTITSFSPSSGSAGTSVVITGTNFSATPTENIVTFYDNKTAVVTASTTTSITATVPSGAATGKISVTTNCVTVTSTADFTIGAPSLPTIISFTPSSGPVGTTVTITGTNFSTTPANNTVQFNGTTAVASASTATSITTTVPAGATTGKITVTVGGNTATSATNFTVTIPGTITFTTQPVDRIVCAGATTTFSLTATGDTNLQYQWQIDNTGFVNLANNATYSGVSSATLTITNPTVALSGKVYRCLVRGDNTTNTSSASATLTVNSTPAAPTISTIDLGCAPASTTLTPSGAVAGQSYRYYDAATAGNLVSSGASFNTPLLSASTTYFISTYHTTTLCESARTPAVVTVQTCNPPVVMATTSAAYLEGIVNVDLSSLISDPDNNLDISTLKIISQPVSGATATLDAFRLTVDYNGLPFSGADALTIEICDLTEICTQQELTIETGGDITVYNAVSPDGDGKNDTFLLRYIDLFTDTKDNKVTIFNRWGDVIFEIENYDNKDRVFRGLNKGGNEVPSGTYFYKVEYRSGRAEKMGYLVLKR